MCGINYINNAVIIITLVQLQILACTQNTHWICTGFLCMASDCTFISLTASKYGQFLCNNT